jgi:hypothetical protein
MALLTEKGIGHERLARELLIIMVDNLAAAMDLEDAKWNTLDAELALKLGVDHKPLLQDKIVKPNFYFGHRPSLIEAPVASYPNLSVYSNQSGQSADQGDHMEGFQLLVGIELMCIDGPYDQTITGFNRQGEDRVNKKIQRAVESVHAVVLAHRSLNGLIAPIDTPPRTQFTEPMLRREQTGYGSDFYWQMARMEYFIRKVSTLY